MITDLKHNTKLPESDHQAFLNEIGFNLINCKKKDVKQQQRLKLLKRKLYLNKRFIFSNENILKFETLSHKLTAMQTDCIVKLKAIEERIKGDLMINVGQFTDYNISLNIQFDCYSIHYGIDVLYKTENLIYSNLEDEEYLAFINKNYANIDCNSNYKIQFAHFHQCRVFHYLISESHLALQDILLLENVWFDITVDYQTKHALK